MDTIVRITAVLSDRARSGNRVAEAAIAADARDRGRTPDRDAAQQSSQALVPVALQPDRPGFGRPVPSVPFLTQLAGGATPSGGERRVRRDPAAVAPRATGAYTATGRLTSDLEPGFIVVKEV